MSNAEILMVLLILLLTIGVFIYFILWAFTAIALGFIESVYIMIFNKPFMPHCEFYYRTLEPLHEEILKRHSKYYRLLPEKKKKVFTTRMLKFLKQKTFVAMGEMRLTEEIKILVAESAVKLTFGLRNYRFEKFNQIYIFKGTFFSDATKTLNLGETNPRGVIVFSWKGFTDGNSNDSDNINLGVHEFAHAYMIDNKVNEEQYFESQCRRFENYYNNMERINFLKEQHYFRNYAFTNKMEFFAVAAEHFFETPERMQAEIPDLYKILCKMLNQDPARFYMHETRLPEINPSDIAAHKTNDSAPPDMIHRY